MAGKRISRGTEGPEQSWKLKDIQQLIDVLIEREVAEFELEKDGMRIRIRRQEKNGVLPAAPSGAGNFAPAVPAASPSPAAAAPANEPLAPPPGTEEVTEEVCVMKSPIVGTFFTSPAPDAPPFVSLGDDVSVGQVICIVEAMKLMNEIEAEVGGEIVRIHAENGQPVEYGQPLFTIKPSKPK